MKATKLRNSVATLPLSRMRAAIARTVSQSWREIPHFTVTVAIDMGEAEEVRRELKESGTPLSINDLIVRAAALSLQKFAQVNNSFAGDRIMINEEINIGLAVGLEEGLVVPVIKGCQGLSLKEIDCPKPGAGRPGEGRKNQRSGVGRRDLHHLQPRHVRGGGVHGGDPASPGGDPGGGGGPGRGGGEKWSDCRGSNHASHPLR